MAKVHNELKEDISEEQIQVQDKFFKKETIKKYHD
jgi:hypothetical protein